MSWVECLTRPDVCLASEAGDKLTESVWDSFLNWMARGLTELSAYTFQAFSLSTSPQFNQRWWHQNFDLIVAISLPLLVGVFVLQCVSAAIRREPGRLGHALLGALLGTAGVPFAVAIVAACGRAVDQLSFGILGNVPATADGLKRMMEVTVLLTPATFGGAMATAIVLGLLATIALYFVMLIREVAIIAFVVFAPIAMASWTWSATRHWLRRWVEIVGALLFSKVVMAVIFTLGLSAVGGSDPNSDASIGTFMTGILLFAMAAFAPLATYSFIHWAGDQGNAATHALQQGTAGASALKERAEQAQQWSAHHFGGAGGDKGSDPVVGQDSDQTPTRTTDDAAVGSSSDRGEPVSAAGTAAAPMAPGGGGDASTSIAVATSQVSVDGSSGSGQQPDGGRNGETGGGERS